MPGEVKRGRPLGIISRFFASTEEYVKNGGIRKNVLGKNPMTEGIFLQRGVNRGELVIPHREKAIDLETIVGVCCQGLTKYRVYLDCDAL